jgi:hypothetical protein
MNGTNSSAKHYDMVVIGSGAAGHHGAIQAAKLGKKIAGRTLYSSRRGQYQHRYDSEQGTSGGFHAFYPIRVHGSPDLGLKPGAENSSTRFSFRCCGNSVCPRQIPPAKLSHAYRNGFSVGPPA